METTRTEAEPIATAVANGDQSESRLDALERGIAGIVARLDGAIGSARPAFQVAIQTFAPEPFEPIRDLSVVVTPDGEGFVATLFDANIATGGDTPEEAVADLKGLILAHFRDFEAGVDEHLGPAMLRQKAVLDSLIRRAR